MEGDRRQDKLTECQS